MELFLPSIFLLIVALIIIVLIIPQFSPLIITLISAAILVAATYNHFTMFWNEYTQSTWQQGLKLCAPGIIILAIFFYLLIAIGSFFTGGKVPVPAVPAINVPSAASATNFLTSTLNNSMAAVADATDAVKDTVTGAVNQAVSRTNESLNAMNNANNNSKNITRSKLAVI